MNQLDLFQLEATENVQYCLGLDVHILLMFNICISPQCPNLVKNVKCDWFRERSSQRAGSCCWICGSVTERKWKSPAVVRVNNHKLVHLLLLFSFYLCYSVHRASPETIEWVNVCERVRKCVCVSSCWKGSLFARLHGVRWLPKLKRQFCLTGCL